MEPAVVLLRWAQYAAGFVLTGGALFALYGLPREGQASAAALSWPRRLLATSAALLLLTSALGLIAQTAVVAGSFVAALDPATLGSVLTEMAMGPASVARIAAGGLALALLVLGRPGWWRWLAVSLMGAIATASFAWMGHGAATEGAAGALHLFADLAHLGAAAVWIGALAFFVVLAVASGDAGVDRLTAFHHALARFSGIGSGLVAVLLGTGLINSWYLVGPAGLERLFSTLYGGLLLLKVAGFGLMLGLAAINRFRLTPRLRSALNDPERAKAAVAALKRSLGLEAGVSLMVLALVAWLGRLAPLSSQ